MNMINRLRVLAGLEPLRERADDYNRPHFDHAAYAAKVKNMPEEQLRFIIKDAQEAMKANPDSPKSKYGYYADEINYCVSELHRRNSPNYNSKAKSDVSNYVSKAENYDESVETKEEVVVEKEEKSEPVIVKEEQKEVPEVKFDTPNAFTSDEFDKIIKKVLNDVNSVHYDSDTAKLNKYKTPKDVIKACKERIKEIGDSIAIDDEKGYNDNSVKIQSIECIEQILQNLSSNDEEGYKQAVIYHTTLAGQYLHWLPNQLIKYLTQG